MKHPALTRVLAIILAVLSLTMAAAGALGLRQAQKDRRLTAEDMARLRGRIEEYRSVTENLEGVTSLIFDLGLMEYTSSAGLRVFLKAQKMMNRQGKMKLTHVSEAVMEILDITGFTDIMTVE